jgi:thiol-disulfide isomerase/thioredoxin
VTTRFWLGIGALVLFTAAFALLLAAGLPSRAAYSGQILPDGQAVAPEIGALAPSWQAPTLAETVDLEALRGAPIVINFWATWCVPCRVEMPELQTFHDAHPTVSILAVNLGESREQIVDWVNRLGLTFDIALDANGSIASLYRLRGQPSTYVVSPSGVITAIFYGPTTRQTLEAALAPFIDIRQNEGTA